MDRNNIIKKTKKYFDDNFNLDVKQIYYDETTEKMIVLAPEKGNKFDGMYLYNNGPAFIPFTPTQDVKLYREIVKPNNLIYKMK